MDYRVPLLISLLGIHARRSAAATPSFIAFSELHPGSTCARTFDGVGDPTGDPHCAAATNLDIIVPSTALNVTSRRYLMTAIDGASLPTVFEFDADTAALVATVSLSRPGGDVSFDPFGLVLDHSRGLAYLITLSLGAEPLRFASVSLASGTVSEFSVFPRLGAGSEGDVVGCVLNEGAGLAYSTHTLRAGGYTMCTTDVARANSTTCNVTLPVDTELLAFDSGMEGLGLIGSNGTNVTRIDARTGRATPLAPFPHPFQYGASYALDSQSGVLTAILYNDDANFTVSWGQLDLRGSGGWSVADFSAGYYFGLATVPPRALNSNTGGGAH